MSMSAHGAIRMPVKFLNSFRAIREHGSSLAAAATTRGRQRTQILQLVPERVRDGRVRRSVAALPRPRHGRQADEERSKASTPARVGGAARRMGYRFREGFARSPHWVRQVGNARATNGTNKTPDERLRCEETSRMSWYFLRRSSPPAT
jgi:hypothetical protein